MGGHWPGVRYTGARLMKPGARRMKLGSRPAKPGSRLDCMTVGCLLEAWHHTKRSLALTHRAHHALDAAALSLPRRACTGRAIDAADRMRDTRGEKGGRLRDFIGAALETLCQALASEPGGWVRVSRGRGRAVGVRVRVRARAWRGEQPPSQWRGREVRRALTRVVRRRAGGGGDGGGGGA